MKRFLTAALAALLLFSLPACGGTPADDVPEVPDADTQPQEPETPADSGTSDGSTEAPSISLPTQEEVEQAASSLYNAASTILDAIYNASSQNDAA